MNKKGQVAIVGTAIALIVGMVALSIIWSMVSTSTTNLYANATDTEKTWSVNTIMLSNDGVVENSYVLITNASDATLIMPAVNYTVTYNTGKIVNATDLPEFNKVNITYTYWEDTAIRSGMTRTIITFIAPLFAVALILIVAIFKRK